MACSACATALLGADVPSIHALIQQAKKSPTGRVGLCSTCRPRRYGADGDIEVDVDRDADPGGDTSIKPDPDPGGTSGTNFGLSAKDVGALIGGAIDLGKNLLGQQTGTGAQMGAKLGGQTGQILPPQEKETKKHPDEKMWIGAAIVLVIVLLVVFSNQKK